MAEKSIFSKIIDREIPASIVYEDEKTIAFLDISPFEKGHTLVVPKKQHERITDMGESEYADLQKAALRVAKKMKSELKCNVGTLVYGEEVLHVHIHVYPITRDLEVFNFSRTKKYLGNEVEIYLNRLRLK